MRFFRVCLGLGLLTCLPLQAQTDVFTVTGGMGETGDVLSSQVLFDTVSASQGWSFGICHDGALLSILSATNGATTATVNNGGPPDFNQTNIDPFPGPGVTMGVVISFIGLATLPAGSGYDILDMEYEVIGMVPEGSSSIITQLSFCDTLGSPPVATVLVVGGASVVPPQVGGTVTILPPPTFALLPTCVGSTTFATLTWELIGDFDYVLFHRDGELLEMFDASVTSYLDDPLAPGTYHYVWIAVAFPDPTGTPVVVVSECDVEIIPVTIADGGISPTVGPYCGGTTVTILGTGFSLPGLTVEFGGLTAANIVVIDDTQLTCETPPSTFIGSVDVLVSNDLGSDSVVNGFTYGFVRGDANDDCTVDLADAIYGLDYLFTQGPAPACEDALDANDDGDLRIADCIYIIAYLFDGGSPPPVPFNPAGLDPTGDPLGCL
ncbi:MAG: IPT/TIG domain-containing protein [Planctomycetota bacterium]